MVSAPSAVDVGNPVPTGNEMLRITDLHAFYGESHVLHGIDLRVAEGELVTLLGRNGAGRSTTLKSVMGLVGRRSGSIMFNGRELIGMAPHRVTRLGVGFCPEERGIFSGLSTEENLMLPPVVRSGGMTIDEIYDVFPNLYERRASPGTRLSGGEQQMLAMARILRTGARLLLLDEITEGLAPVIVKKLGEVIRLLKARGYTIVLVEQNFRFAAPLADRHYVLEHGRIVATVRKDELAAKTEMLHELLGV
ncbi:ABC transporter ATP-binding protein [Thauera aminoaromatica]|uniref:ABC transporter ATP-binding protein n=2 Tax=Betaproteobacteria TaxID=28216 RepID=A0A5C7SLZ9_THASP|nr:ABC transporter ATP-binding protein [Thauera aminoaromatica]TXH84643.1 MAG: ABC transporter ATP-binding protein [Thauera aminoaromatica]